jgi:hypothetical protein
MLLPAVAGPLISTALGSLSESIALPSLMGIELNGRDESIVGLTQDEEDFIAIFADLEGMLTLSEEANIEMDGMSMDMNEMNKASQVDQLNTLSKINDLRSDEFATYLGSSSLLPLGLTVSTQAIGSKSSTISKRIFTYII